MARTVSALHPSGKRKFTHGGGGGGHTKAAFVCARLPKTFSLSFLVSCCHLGIKFGVIFSFACISDRPGLGAPHCVIESRFVCKVASKKKLERLDVKHTFSFKGEAISSDKKRNPKPNLHCSGSPPFCKAHHSSTSARKKREPEAQHHSPPNPPLVNATEVCLQPQTSA